MNKINPVYSVQEKQNGDAVNGTEWNALNNAVTQAQNKINEIIDNGGGSGSSGGGSSSGTSDSHISVNEKGNLTIETTEADIVNSKGAKINIEPYSDLQIKPGDDISLYSHHRSNKEEVSVKVLNGEEVSATDNAQIAEYPVDLQLNAANLVLTTKDKGIYISEKNKARAAKGKNNTQDKYNVLNTEIKTGTKASAATASNGQYGYLKVRAQAIDLRCEDHGGIALQPKGYDSDGNMNKIKFEHGGGDGLEFGTFNTEKSSLYTDEYRFKRDGIIKLATRTTVASNKTDDDGIFDNTPSGKTATNALKYEKQADDFYDIIDNNDPQCTWEDIINTASVFYIDNSVKYKGSSVDPEIKPGGGVIPQIKEYDITINHGTQDSSFIAPPFGVLPSNKIYSSISDLENDLNIPSGTLSAANVDFSKNIHTVLNIKHFWLTSNSTDPNVQDTTPNYSNLNQIAFDSFTDTMVKTPLGNVNLNDIYTVIEYFKNNNTTGPFANS